MARGTSTRITLPELYQIWDKLLNSGFILQIEKHLFSVEIYGSTDAGAFDSHLWYGRALFELCNLQEDVLDNAMKNMPEPSEDDSIDEEQFGDPEKLPGISQV